MIVLDSIRISGLRFNGRGCVILLPRGPEDFSTFPFYQVIRSVEVFFHLNLFKGPARRMSLELIKKRKKERKDVLGI